MSKQILNQDAVEIITNRLIPRPKTATFYQGAPILLDDKLQLTLKATLACEATAHVTTLFKAWFNCTPSLVLAAPAANLPAADGYRLEAAAEAGITIEAANLTGVLNALKTLRQLAEPERGLPRLRHYFVEPCAIEDEPELKFRGIHICWFPETSSADIEQAIRLAAYYKFNYLVLEPWGVFDYKSHPEFAWQEFKVPATRIGELVRIARDQGLTPIPQLNLFGHAAEARHISGKHVALDFNPALQPLFEPDGWTWCLTNPHARATLTDLVEELHDAFDAPPFFHGGCDEAFSMATCHTCRNSDYAALLKEHLLHFHQLFKARQAQLMIWHDMLVVRGDPRWQGFTSFGSKRIDTEGLLKSLPRDIIICDWQYDDVKEGLTPAWPTMLYFHEQGFPTLACPWYKHEATTNQAEFVRQHGLAGMLCTTWQFLFGHQMCLMYIVGANATWGRPDANMTTLQRSAINRHLRQLGWERGVTKYRDTGAYQTQVPPVTTYPG